MASLTQQERKKLLSDLLATGGSENTAVAQEMGYEGPMNDSNMPNFQPDPVASRPMSALMPGPSGYYSMADLDQIERDTRTPTSGQLEGTYDRGQGSFIRSGDIPYNGQIEGTFNRGQGAFKRSGGDVVALGDEGWKNQNTGEVVVPRNKMMNDKGEELLSEWYDGNVLKQRWRVPTIDRNGGSNTSNVIRSRDLGAEWGRIRAEEEYQLKRQKMQAEIAKLEAEAKKSSGDDGGYEGAAKKAALMAQTPGTAEYKRVQEDLTKKTKMASAAEATRQYAQSNADMLETSLADILGVTPDKLPEILGDEKRSGKAKSRVAPAVGVFDVRTPTLLQGTQDIGSAIENLKSKAQMFGLSKLRQSGVAPGSITEKEWPKFESTLGNIDPSLSESAFVKQLRDVYKQVQSARSTGEQDYSELTGEAAPRQPLGSKGAAVPVRSEAEALSLPPGTRFILNGRTGTAR